jgi:transposase
MRGYVDRQSPMFVACNVEDRIPAEHPLRKVKAWADAVLVEMRRDFAAAYSDRGRPGIPPEQMLKALLLRAIYSIPSERRLMEAIEFNLLYRWFVDLPPDQPAWTPEAFSVNRERFMAHNLARKFFDRVVGEAIDRELISNDHFTADGTLIRSLASQKSVRPIEARNDDDEDADRPSGRDAPANWHGQRRRNQTHRSTTDPQARLARKGFGKEAHLCHSAHVLMENRSGLCLDITIDEACGVAERRQALRMLDRVAGRQRLMPRTLGADTGYDAGAFLLALEDRGIEPHVPIRAGRIKARTAQADARRRARQRMKTCRHRLSQRVRKSVEQVIGGSKTVGGLARTRFLGRDRIAMDAYLTGAAHNLLRLTRLT